MATDFFIEMVFTSALCNYRSLNAGIVQHSPNDLEIELNSPVEFQDPSYEAEGIAMKNSRLMFSG